MAHEDLDDLLDAPTPSRLGAQGSQGASRPRAARPLDPISFTLEPTDDDPSEAPALPIHRLAAQAAQAPKAAVRTIEVERRTDPKEENLLYVAMGLGIACTVLALAMLLAGGV